MTQRLPLPTLQRIVAALVFVVIAAGARGADLPTTFDPERDGARDVEYAVSLANADGKRVIVDVGGEWCTWCHVMDRFIAANDDVRDAIDAHYVWVKVNFSKQNENAALLGRWPKVRGYPHLFVLDGNGALVLSQDTEELEAGRSYDKGRFLAFLAKGANGRPNRQPGTTARSVLSADRPTYSEAASPSAPRRRRSAVA